MPKSMIAVATIAVAASTALAVPALAQVRQGNPDAANESMARQGELRSLQQNQTSSTNATRMDIQRSQQMQPAPTGPGPAVIVAPKR